MSVFGRTTRTSDADGAVRTGLLLKRNSPVKAPTATRRAEAAFKTAALNTGAHKLAFAGVYAFTLLLYARPNEVFPSLFGALPLAKMIAILTPLGFVASKLSRGERLTVWPTEVKMVLILAALGVLLIPMASSPGDSIDMLSDTFLKVVLIFVLMVNLLDTRARLLAMINLTLVGGAWIALTALKRFYTGELGKAVGGLARIEGIGVGMFGNPNDVATALNMLLPLAVILAINRSGLVRYAYFICAGLLGLGVLITFSRGGFLGMVALGLVMLWKLSRGRRLRSISIAALSIGVLLLVTPGGYGRRLATILSPNEDTTGSAQARREVLKRAVQVAIAHPLGIGMANFHSYSINEAKAHNSYLEISAELGVAGLLAYLILLGASLRSLWRIERQTQDAANEDERKFHYLSIGLQATLAAYLICSFFTSIQYFWYLYYPVAFAVSLRRIFEREGLDGSSSADPTGKKAMGKLWEPNNRQGVLMQPRPAFQKLTTGGAR